MELVEREVNQLSKANSVWIPDPDLGFRLCRVMAEDDHTGRVTINVEGKYGDYNCVSFLLQFVFIFKASKQECYACVLFYHGFVKKID